MQLDVSADVETMHATAFAMQSSTLEAQALRCSVTSQGNGSCGFTSTYSLYHIVVLL
jgi:hypothetical protein